MRVARNVFGMRFFTLCPAIVLLSSVIASGQTGAAPVQKPSDILNPALSQVKQTIGNLTISRWKAPGDVKNAAQQNADSILNDLNNTLPGLLSTADAAPASVAAGFPVYRNVDALYDVMLRISITANLAAPQSEDDGIASALRQLESARSSFGNLVVTISSQNESELVRLRSVAQKAPAVQTSAPPKTTVVNDGPTKSATTPAKRKKKPVQPAPTTAPAPASPQQ